MLQLAWKPLLVTCYRRHGSPYWQHVTAGTEAPTDNMLQPAWKPLLATCYHRNGSPYWQHVTAGMGALSDNILLSALEPILVTYEYYRQHGCQVHLGTQAPPLRQSRDTSGGIVTDVIKYPTNVHSSLTSALYMRALCTGIW
jgi:hypothetical protein